jgi:metallo-beta-lactamase class B
VNARHWIRPVQQKEGDLRLRSVFQSIKHRTRVGEKAGADVLISNHTNFDGSKTKLPALATRKPGDPHPYVIGSDAVKGYFTVASECAKAVLAGMK